MTRSLWLSTRSVRQKLSRQRITSWEQRLRWQVWRPQREQQEPPPQRLVQQREQQVRQQEPLVQLAQPRVRQAQQDRPVGPHRAVEPAQAVEVARLQAQEPTMRFPGFALLPKNGATAGRFGDGK